MNAGEWSAIATAAGTVLGGSGWFVARATVKAAQVSAEAQRAASRANQAAARATAAPAQQAANLAVLQATVERVDEENGSLRGRILRCESVLRAFSWTVDELYRWARDPIGSPPDPHPLVDEYNRTGA
ncbi:hypothetical protein ABZ401_19495 [Streptomyces sp. NPDC005892]|uniref:hypothetical protein n=1 Tax=Streptomyces sp. NPDC005892 TaxID=3155593 RepID=UPI00340422DB